MSKADQIFLANCQEILVPGHLGHPSAGPPPVGGRHPRPYGQDVSAWSTAMICGRNSPSRPSGGCTLKSAVDELLWIWQKKSNNVRDSVHSRIWDAWADETGSIGKAYGYQMGVKHRYPEGEMDQVDRVLYDLKHNPASRRILTNLYNHHDLSEMALYPCAYSMTFNVTGNTLNAILHQRSPRTCSPPTAGM